MYHRPDTALDTNLGLRQVLSLCFDIYELITLSFVSNEGRQKVAHPKIGSYFYWSLQLYLQRVTQ